MNNDVHFDQVEKQDRAMAPCELCEELLPEFMDGLLTEAEQSWLESHLQGCSLCMMRLAEAKQGSAWLELLHEATPKPRPELLARILAETSGSTDPEVMAWPAAGVPTHSGVLIWPVSNTQGAGVLSGRRASGVPAQALWRTLQEPRLAMTAAMAFFSLALTLNLTGVRLREIHRADLRPASLRRTWYEAHADAVRYYDNLGVVKMLESRLADQDPTGLWRRDEALPEQDVHRAEPQGHPEQKPRHDRRQVPEGTSQLEPALPPRNPGLLNASCAVVPPSVATEGGQV